MEMTFRPIQRWPGKLRAKRKKSQFRAGYGKTLALLDAELRHLGASAVVLQVALSEQDIRLDGKPREKAKAQHPGIILTFESKHGPLNYPCDTYDHWQDNLRAIALALEALRAVNRYGVTAHGEQYRGFAAIAGPGMSPAEARRHLDSYGGEAEALKRSHPDGGGSAEAFQRVLEARRVLKGGAA